MSFYGGRTGQHFYIANVYTSETEMNNDIESILNNQFVLTISNESNVLWIKHNDTMINIGSVGSFYPKINSEGQWHVGDQELGKATPSQIYLRVQYDKESDSYSNDILEYAYGDVADQQLNEDYLNTLEWRPLIEFTGLTNLQTYRDEALDALSTIQEHSFEIKNQREEVLFLTELNKSYINGSGVFDENLTVPEEYVEIELERINNQTLDNAQYYAESAKASDQLAQKSVTQIEDLKTTILNALDKADNPDIVGIKAELDQAARRDGKLSTSQESYFLTDRLDNFLYQFDTYAEMRKCRQLRPGDTCTTLGVSRLGDSNSILFRIYDPQTSEDGETLEDRLNKDLYWDVETSKYFINLPGGQKIASEKQILDNGYVAYSVAMFSGLGGGTGGSGNTSAGSLTVSYTETAISLPGVGDPDIEIPFVWYGTVSGDGRLYVRDSLEGSIINGSTVAEGNQVFKWKPTIKGTHILNIYVRDRMNQNTNVVALTINVGALDLYAQTANNATFSAGLTVNVQFRIESLNKADITLVGGLYKNNIMLQPINTIDTQATLTRNITLSFNNLTDVGAYTVKLMAQSGDLQSDEVVLTFLLVTSGKLSILEMYDESQTHPEGNFIPITYQAYFKNSNAASFKATYFIRGGNIPENECTVTIQNINYKQINSEPIEIKPNVNTTYNLAGTFLTKSEKPYLFMIQVEDTEISNQIAYLSTAIPIIITEKVTEQYPRVDEWRASSLVYYFDSRMGQQNNDILADRITWKNIANNYNVIYNEDGSTTVSDTVGLYNISLAESSFNWATNGWNVSLKSTLHEGLRFDGNAYAYLYPDKNVFASGFMSQTNANKTTGGATIDIYFKPYYTGVNSRLFECAFNNTLTTGIFINETSASMSGSAGTTADDISVEFTPNQPVHLTFVYEPIGIIEQVDKDGSPLKFGMMKIYLNGVCCSAKQLSAPLDVKYFSGFFFNQSASPVTTKTQVGEQEIYSVKIFNNYLTADEVLKLYIKDLPESERKNVYESNFGVENESGQHILPFELPEVHFYVKAKSLNGMDKNNALKMKVELYKKNGGIVELGSKGETWDNCSVTWQGTSSIAYPVKNYKVKLRDNNGKKIKYQLYHGTSVDETNTPLYPRGKKESTFTMKADYMDSSHCHNTGNANFVNDTGLFTSYSLTPAQVRDLDRNINEDETPLVQNGCYYKEENGSHRPYKMSDYTGSNPLEIRNSIYGFPCRLYIHLGDTYDETTGEWTWLGGNYAGIYNFNHDKGCTDTFGLYRNDDDQPVFPQCTSFEISANSNSTAGAFKAPQFVQVHFYDNNGKELVDKKQYGITSFNTRYNEKGSIIYNVEQQDNKDLAYCEVYYCDEDGDNVSDKATYVLYTHLTILDAPTSDAYEKYLRSYYETSFELRFPDADQYEKNGEKTEEYYDEYNKIRALIDWVDKASTTTDNNEFKKNFKKHFDLDSTLNYFLFVMTTGLIDNFGKNLMLNTWGVNSEGKIPYVKNGNNYSLRYFDYEANTYRYGYSNLILNELNQIQIVDADGTAISYIGGTDENGYYDYSKLDLRIYEDADKNLVHTWERIIDINDIVWYPHPYDLDSCLGSDNSGYLRYGTDIEMLPTSQNPGFNDFYTKKWNDQKTPFNTALSSLWYKFQNVFASELATRYGELRQKQILHLDTFKQYYYDQEIGQMTKKDFNDDGYAKYLNDDVANVVVNGEATTVYPSAYAVINRGDDWGRLYMWMEKRLNFLDSFYGYGQKNSVVEIRASEASEYLINITTHDPQYVTVVWSNQADTDDSTVQVVDNIIDGASSGIIYYLALTYINGYEQYGISNKVSYTFDSSINEYIESPSGKYYKFYKADNNGWLLDVNGNPQIEGYYLPTDWYFNIKATRNTQTYKVGKQFVTDTATGVTTLVDNIKSFANKSSTGDQEVQIFGAYNLKTIDGLTSLNAKKLIVKAATKLLDLTCSSPQLAEIDATTATMLRSINLTHCSSLGTLSLPGSTRLKTLDLGSSGVSALILPEDGGNLQTLRLGPAMKSISLSKQRQLSEVTLQRETISTSISDFLNSANPITKIELIDCPNVHFNFEVLTTDFNTGQQIETKISQTNQAFKEYVAEYGLFSIFNKLESLTLNNSYIYNEENNPYGLGQNGEFRLSIMAQETKDAITNNFVKVDYGPLWDLNINIPIKKIIFNNRGRSIVWPGRGIFYESSTDAMEQRSNTFRVGNSVKEIEVIGTGVTYMPCVNYWGNMSGLEKVTLSGEIRNKESRLINYENGFGTERNALVIILPNEVDIGNGETDQIFKEFTLNTVLDGANDANKRVDITSVFAVDDLDTYSVDYADGNRWVAVKLKNSVSNEEYKIVDLSKFSANGIKMNFSQLRYITTIKGFENINIGNNSNQLNNFENLFYNCNELTDIQDSSGTALDITSINTYSGYNLYNQPVESMARMFYKCYNLKPQYIIPLFNRVQNHYLTNATQMVRECHQLTDINLSWKNCLKLTTLSGFAYQCNKLKNFAISNLQCGDQLTDLSYLVYFYSGGTSDLAVESQLESFVLDLRKTDETSIVNSAMTYITNMSYLLYGASKLTELDMSSWNLNNIITISNMCNECTSLTTVLAPNGSKMFGDNDNEYIFNSLNNLDYAFAKCNSLKTFLADEEHQSGRYIWKFNDNQSVSLSGLLQSDNSLNATGLWAILQWPMTNVIKMDNLLNSATGPLQLDLSNWDLSKVIDASSMLKSYNSRTLSNTSELIYNGDKHFSSLERANNMFEASNFVKIDTSIIPNSAPLTTIYSIFKDCKVIDQKDENGNITASGLGEGYKTWIVNNVSNFENVFQNIGVNSLNLDTWNFDKGNTFTNMFSGMSNLTSFGSDKGISHLITANNSSTLINIKNIFNGCASLQENFIKQFYNWQLSNKVNDFTGVFAGCKKLTSTDNLFDLTQNYNGGSTNRVIINSMFNGCTGLTSAVLPPMVIQDGGAKNVFANSFATLSTTDNIDTEQLLDLSQVDFSKILGSDLDTFFDSCRTTLIYFKEKTISSNISIAKLPYIERFIGRLLKQNDTNKYNLAYGLAINPKSSMSAIITLPSNTTTTNATEYDEYLANRNTTGGIDWIVAIAS